MIPANKLQDHPLTITASVCLFKNLQGCWDHILIIFPMTAKVKNSVIYYKPDDNLSL